MTTETLSEHLSSGTSDVARCWRLTRKDGTQFGFTDHDVDIQFEGLEFKANSGLSAGALTQTTGLSVDNSEAVGALSDTSIREADLAAGRFDDAAVEAWHVCWSNPDIRELVFRGTLGEVTRTGQAFSAELRGLAEALNRPTGNVYHSACSCVLGDAKCGVHLETPPYSTNAQIALLDGGRAFRFKGLGKYQARWFEKGTLTVQDGPASDLSGVIKNDRVDGSLRVIELWAPLGVSPNEDDTVRLTVGCDKRMETCRLKFDNVLNFRGFPDIPGEDWLVAHPTRAWVLNGGSRR